MTPEVRLDVLFHRDRLGARPVAELARKRVEVSALRDHRLRRQEVIGVEVEREEGEGDGELRHERTPAAGRGRPEAPEQHLQQRRLDQQQRERQTEGEEPLRLVDHALRRLLAEVVRQIAGERHPEGVHQDRDRDRREHDHDALQHALAEEVGEHDGERPERHQRAQAAARLRDEERRVRQVDDVALAQGGDRQPVQPFDRQIRGDQLEREGDHVHERLRQRHHQEQEQQREAQDPEDRRAEQQQHQADQRQHEGGAHRHQLDAEPADHQRERSEGERQRPPTSSARSARAAACRAAPRRSRARAGRRESRANSRGRPSSAGPCNRGSAQRSRARASPSRRCSRSRTCAPRRRLRPWASPRPWSTHAPLSARRPARRALRALRRARR